MNTSELIAKVRRILDSGSGVGSGPWSDHDLLGNLNDALRWIYARQITLNPMAYMEVKTLGSLTGNAAGVSLGAGMTRYTLPHYVAIPIAIFRAEDEPIYMSSNLRDFGSMEGSHRNLDHSPGRKLGLQALAGRGQDIILRGGVQTNASEMVVAYVHRPGDLARATLVEDGTTTTFTVSTLGPVPTPTGAVDASDQLGSLKWRDSEYVGANVEISASNNQAPQSQVRTVSANTVGTYPNMTFTVSSAFSAVPKSGDTVDMIPEIDPLFHELPCYMAAERSLESIGKTEAKMMIRETTALLFEEWKAIAANRNAFSKGGLYPGKS